MMMDNRIYLFTGRKADRGERKTMRLAAVGRQKGFGLYVFWGLKKNLKRVNRRIKMLCTKYKRSPESEEIKIN